MKTYILTKDKREGDKSKIKLLTCMTGSETKRIGSSALREMRVRINRIIRCPLIRAAFRAPSPPQYTVQKADNES